MWISITIAKTFRGINDDTELIIILLLDHTINQSQVTPNCLKINEILDTKWY